ncbi:MAG: hypothetical protein GXO07_03940 [Crenarchaeota archaeon]|nr:hypothetical protein [Thermoproteota archaeon]
MSVVDAIVRASASSLLFDLGFSEEHALREAEAELLRFVARAGTKPLDVGVSPSFSELIAKVGEAVLTETAERAEVLLEVLKLPDGYLKEKLADLLSVDIIDVIAMIADMFGGSAEDVYASFAEIGNKESRARAAVSTFASLLLEALRKEHPS